MVPDGRTWYVEESLEVPLPPREVHALVADVRRMGQWSPEVFRVWRCGRRFVGFNRRALWVWFTTCRITVEEPGREFAFDVTALGLPLARWGYRFAPAGEGTLVTEYWRDHRRRGGRGRAADLLGLVFAGTPPTRRAARNREGMRTTLRRLRTTCAELAEGRP